jgi:4-hydroxyphenylpyruvate dioxygenase
MRGSDKTLDWPAIKGIGGSLIYFTDQYWDTSPYNDEFDWVSNAYPEGVGFYYLDHLTHNVFKGNMDTWFRFYGDLFNFDEIRFFDIEGKYTGLLSRALTSPCGRIRIPINEDRGETGQIVNYLKKYKGEGIQHIAVGARNIYDAVDAIAERGIALHARPARDVLSPEFRPREGPRRAGRPDEAPRHPDRWRRCRGWGRDADPVADLLQDRDRTDLLRVHRAQGG